MNDRSSPGSVAARVLCTLSALLLLLWWWDGRRAIAHAPGALAPEEPAQSELVGDDANVRMHEGFRIVPQARFELRARVLARKDYQVGTESEISPTDLALGWGLMSDSATLSRIEITQADRWYRWYSQDPTLPLGDVESHSANMHMVPADAQVAQALASVREGALLRISGLLVNVEQVDTGWHWQTSLSRTDTGAGACELVWVRELQLLDSGSE